ncbi:glycosyl hydrolase [Imperialibacter roseus]|uniref:Glycosyl hydrolase n=1 Tax=Imperialibacter roseus TaxID=1324217 RepID=A0ABZ0IV97_9BACT|nr:glycosyl hydrolase [Imperialibacter roseus]WOK08300.1 glycosyl hydrolase [Imperialibacter roseus]
MRYLLILLPFALLLSCQTTPQQDWPAESLTTKPWTRWWWMGNAVDDANIRKQLIAYHEAGLGGVEITPIYGAMGFEEQYIDYLSKDWMDRLQTVIRVADSLGMGVDMNLGTGWPYGGPQITPEYAASKMIVQQYTLKAGQALKEKITVNDEKQAAMHPKLATLMAYRPESTIDLTDSLNENGLLQWVPDANYELYAIFAGKTGQMVKRAAPGGAGLVMDHLNKESFPVYTARFGEAFGTPGPNIRSFFNDSYEVYGANFTPTLFDAFERNRGYDLKPYLPTLLSSDSSATVRRLKADYRQTMGEMLLANFSEPWKNWINNHGALSRNQAHGSPANLLDVYAATDIPECETFGYSGFDIPGARNYTHSSRHLPPDLYMLKFASSAAHAAGKPLVSSETFTWLGEHFKTPLSQTKPELDQAFLAGVNHVFFHGTTYSPAEVQWPGWLFYASTNFAPSNSWWPHIDGLTGYINRSQSVLQTGQADGDVLLYFPYDDAAYFSGKKSLEYLFTVHNIDEWLHPTNFYATAKRLTEKGYLVDYISESWLEKLAVPNGQLSTGPNGTSYKALVIPKMTFMSTKALKTLLKLKKQGATIILQGLPEDVPGLHNLEQRRAILDSLVMELGTTTSPAGNVQASLTAAMIQPERLAALGLKFVRRVDGNNTYYFIVNQRPEAFDGWVPFNKAFKQAVILDAMTGRAGNAETKAENGLTQVRMQIKSGESLFLKVGNESSATDWSYANETGGTVALNGPWALDFKAGGPSLPGNKTLDKLQPWTTLGDSLADQFSGTATYATHFILASKKDDYLLQLGDVRESAKIWVNGQYAGNSWAVPHELRIGKYLKEGDNTIEIEVVNLMANRIRYMDRAGIEWRKYHEINFVNIDYQAFDASSWEVQPSGLLGPVKLVEVD